MPVSEFDALTFEEVRALIAAIRSEDSAKIRREAAFLAMFCNAHFKRATGGNFEAEDFLPLDMQEATAEQKMEARVANLRANISRGPNVTNTQPAGETPGAE